MENCCKSRWDVLGTYRGDRKSNEDEHRQGIELFRLLQEGNRWRENQIGFNKSEVSFLYRCPQCGQLWATTTEGSGHGEHTVYTKISVEDAKRKFPDAKLD